MQQSIMASERTALAALCVGAGVTIAIARRRFQAAVGDLSSRQHGASSRLSDAAVADLPFIEADLKFKAGTHDKGEDVPVPERVKIYDARTVASRFTLDGHGFALVERVPKYSNSLNFYDSPEAVLKEVYPKMEAMLLARCPGATRVLIFDHLLRNRVRLEDELEDAARAACRSCGLGDTPPLKDDEIPLLPVVRKSSSCHQEEQRCMQEQRQNQMVQPKTRFLEMPLGHVHGDYTVRSGHTRARQLLEPYCSPDEVAAALSQRFAIINIWHPIGPEPVVADPLCMCVWGSFAPRDVMTKRLTFPHRVGETYQCLNAPTHRWVHYSHMNRDEAILLKTFDSQDDGRTARFSIHTAFRTPAQDDPRTAASLPTRESIELRALVFYGDDLESLAPGFVNPSLAGADAPPKVREQAELTELELYNLISSELMPAGDKW